MKRVTRHWMAYHPFLGARCVSSDTATAAAGPLYPGFSIVSLVTALDGTPAGFRLRVSFDRGGHVMMKYAPQRVAVPEDRHTNASHSSTVFGTAMTLRLTPAVVVRFLVVLEGKEERVDFRTKTATGTFATLANYEFRLTAHRTSGSTTDDVPTTAQVIFDPGNAVLLHRCLTIALDRSMGFFASEKGDLPTLATDTSSSNTE